MILSPDPTGFRAFRVRAVSPRAPLRWLAQGWADLRACPLPGLLHGAVATLFGWGVLGLAHQRFWALAGAFSGFLIVAPLCAFGLYAISRGRAQGRSVGLADALAAWRPHDSRAVRFGLLLALAGTGWVLTSAALITVLAPLPVNSPLDFLRVVVLRDDHHVFEIWLALGAFLAAPVFASSVVALPMLLDRPHGVVTAVSTSVVATLVNPAGMALWASVLLGLSLLGMATGLLGLVVVVPWLAHASWHAYADLVVPADADPASADADA